MSRAPQIAVIGKGAPDDALAPLAHEVGGLLAEAGVVIVCGGLGEVMEAAARGASAAKGTVSGSGAMEGGPGIEVVQDAAAAVELALRSARPGA